METNTLRRFLTLAGTAALAAVALGTAVAEAQPTAPMPRTEPAQEVLAAPYRVTPWMYATVRNQPRSAGKPVDRVTAHHGYDAYCWLHGEKINGNTIWVRQLGNARIQGYVPAAFLEGGVTGGVATKC
ncbi:hypothetical protein ACFWMR_10450 [Amycolatopsis thailandensis]|uniref:hypothetical protein n=1 Tax=Amycolatopsis thailandensis TaxID=589330 RepID=UPI00364A4FDB